VYIPHEENEKNIDTFLSRNDIILSKTAYPACSLVTLENCNTSQDTVAIKLKKDSKFNSHFLTIYFNTNYGLELMKILFTGNIQTHLNLTATKNIVIPIFSESFQNSIKNIFIRSIKKTEKSKTLYKQAEELLLKELDLLNFKPSKESIAIKLLNKVLEIVGDLIANIINLNMMR
jgi:restriction endonuclease S subunit